MQMENYFKLLYEKILSVCCIMLHLCFIYLSRTDVLMFHVWNLKDNKLSVHANLPLFL